MMRNSLVAVAAFLAGLCIGYYARSVRIGTPHKVDSHAAGLAAIEKLHTADVAAALTQDPASPN
jgi:hypothetical protein